MQRTDNTKKLVRVSKRLKEPKVLWGIVGAVIIIIALIFALNAMTKGGASARTESYKDTSGGAGLDATIKYDCGKPSCEGMYDFNIYVFKDNGQQVNVVRPDKEGKIHLAMAEGDYSMLIGKIFGDNKTFPQEPLALKNGKTLELKLEYK